MERAIMNLEQQKERALTFLKNFEKPDAKVYENIIDDNFEFEMMGRLPGISPLRGKDAFLKAMPSTLKSMFPNGLNMKFHTIIGEGPHVAIQAESDTTAGNGKKYANRYHFYFLFNGDKIAQVREYNDVNHVREVFMT
jgi:ketosteroid isomerase-like protein